MSESDYKRTTELNIQASSAPMAKREAALAAYYGYNEGEEGATADNMDPSRPFLVLEKFDLKKIDEWDRLRSEFLAKSIPNDIIIPDPTPQLVNIISEAGEDLNKYIQAHSEKPHVEVLEHVSSILKDHGFCPTGEGIDVRNLRPYNCKLSDRELYNKGHVNAAKAVTETAHAAGEKVRKKLPRGWDPEYSRRMFYPYWRSVLGAKCHVKVYPSYAPSDAAFCGFDIKELRNYWADSTGNGSSQKPKRNLGVLVKIQRPASNHQSIRPFGTAAFTLLKKVLRK
ncbi:uncharacterized protein LOC133902428 isoform X2 [Phragmites australis]|uniref:uncharacterized protein LOC133902428 isoform X2 n=1 Tax=Phragmites australis TaxID=29695 RepID=UPI002D76AA8E|nr:uncharacterized protein LOC133902428 isoform X2 [Phragmites australis]